jgi:hypothetical protein
VTVRRQEARLLRKGLAGRRLQNLRPLVTVRRQHRRPVRPPQMLRRRLLEARLHPHPPAAEPTVLRRRPQARR